MAATKSAIAIAQTVADIAGYEAPSSLTSRGDQPGRRLLGLLNQSGRDLAAKRGQWGEGWPEQNRQHVIVADGSTDVYDLPADFSDAIQGTFWDRTTYRPNRGPIDPYYWAYLESGLAAPPAESPRWRLRFDLGERRVRIQFQPLPNPGTRMAFDYVSNHWLRAGPNEPVDADEITLDSQHPIFPANVCEMDLLWRLLHFKGEEYRMALGLANREINRQFVLREGPQVISMASDPPADFALTNYPRHAPTD